MADKPPMHDAIYAFRKTPTLCKCLQINGSSPCNAAILYRVINNIYTGDNKEGDSPIMTAPSRRFEGGLETMVAEDVGVGYMVNGQRVVQSEVVRVNGIAFDQCPLVLVHGKLVECLGLREDAELLGQVGMATNGVPNNRMVNSYYLGMKHRLVTSGLTKEDMGSIAECDLPVGSFVLA